MGGLNIDSAVIQWSQDARTEFAKQYKANLFQQEFGRNLSDKEASKFDSILNPKIDYIFNQSAGANPDLSQEPTTAGQQIFSTNADLVKQTQEQALPALYQTYDYKTLAKQSIHDKIAESLKTTMGITDESVVKKVIDNNASLYGLDKAVDTGVAIKDLIGDGPTSISKAVDTINNNRIQALETLYTGAHSKALNGAKEEGSDLNKDLDAFIADPKIANTDYGLDLLNTSDIAKNRATAAQIESDITTNHIENNPAIVKTIETAKTAETAATPYDAETVTSKLNAARDALATDLAKSQGNLTNDLTKAYNDYVGTIPKQIQGVKDISQARLDESLKKLPEQFGEFGARMGLGVGQSGQLQQALSKEVATQQSETDRRLQEYQLGLEGNAAQMKYNLDTGLASQKNQQEQSIAQLGYGISEMGTQIGRQDWQTLLAQQYQNQQIAQSQEYNTFLTQMGYQQNQLAQQTQFGNQLSMQYQQQAFNASQSELDRQLQERMFNTQAELYNKQQNDAKKASRASSLQSLAGTALGAAAGYFLPGGGTMATTLLGAGIGGGNSGLTAAGAYGYFNK